LQNTAIATLGQSHLQEFEDYIRTTSSLPVQQTLCPAKGDHVRRSSDGVLHLSTGGRMTQELLQDHQRIPGMDAMVFTHQNIVKTLHEFHI
jgi:hypothetical protein